MLMYCFLSFVRGGNDPIPPLSLDVAARCAVTIDLKTWFHAKGGPEGRSQRFKKRKVSNEVVNEARQLERIVYGRSDSLTDRRGAARVPL